MLKTKLYAFIAIIIISGAQSSCRKKTIEEKPDSTSGHEASRIVETEIPELIGISKEISANIKGYFQAVPRRYNESTTPYPLLVCFHGGGQFGNGNADLQEVLLEGVPKLLNEKKFPPSFMVNSTPFSFIVIAPQFVRMPTNSDIDALLTYLQSEFRVDSSRIYLTGFSLGARMLSNFAAYKPAKIAAITAMGGLPQINSDLQAKCQAMVNANLPIWNFHNRDDSAWSYSEAVKYIEVLNSLTPRIAPRFTSFFPGEGKAQHDSWTRTTNPDYREDGKNIYEWMLSHSR